MVRSRSTAEVDLKEYVEGFEDCVRAALREFAKTYGPMLHKHTASGQAKMIHDLMIWHVKDRYGADPNVKLRERGSLFEMIVKLRYVLRLKKLRKLRPRNAPTQGVLAFMSQRRSEPKQLPLKGHEPLTSLILGYEQHPLVIDESRVWLTCPDGYNILWAWMLTKDAPKVLDFEPKESQRGKEETKRRARKRLTQEEKQQSEQAKKDKPESGS